MTDFVNDRSKIGLIIIVVGGKIIVGRDSQVHWLLNFKHKYC
jgi:predicted acyltransferase (DUF342 family)